LLDIAREYNPKAVREVYEHIYETVDITGNDEVRANATAKVC